MERAADDFQKAAQARAAEPSTRATGTSSYRIAQSERPGPAREPGVGVNRWWQDVAPQQ